jgi:ATP-binding protein involved in chromosome partitioning
MSYLELPNSNQIIDIFGRGGGKDMADRLNVPFLGEIPIDPEIRKGGDEGNPIILSHPESPAALAFMDIAKKVLEALE